MAFILFSKEIINDDCILKNTEIPYQLAGRQLIYNLWVKRGKPLNEGWHLSVNDILQECNPNYNSTNHALIIDFDPHSKNRIGLVSISDIYIYTFEKDDKADWSPLMLKLKSVYEEDFENLTPTIKAEKLSKIKWREPEEFIIDFLYINGDALSWNWGRNGGTNGAFLYKRSMDYFKQYI